MLEVPWDWRLTQIMIREYTVNLPSLFLSKGIYWKVIAISQKKREKDEKERENKERKRDFWWIKERIFERSFEIKKKRQKYAELRSDV